MATWIGSSSSAASWDTLLPLVERGQSVIVVAPVFREKPLMEALWRRLKDGKGGVYLVGSRMAPTDPASYFVVFSYFGAELRILNPWPLKPEGSFVVVDGKRGMLGSLVAGLGDPDGKTRELTEEEARAWWEYGRRLVLTGKKVSYNLEAQAILYVLQRLGLVRR
ncbi:hypothetical protein [Thermus albus]|uniref:hypothetical protein n=1 Tax=Thermus albus TaxID=2908146 RepID=UPI001FA9DF86|nr:hypothetical protein [Thermus albus]